MATNRGWGRSAVPPPPYEQCLGTHDCDPAIGELVLRGDVVRLFDPSGYDYDSDWPFDYSATLELNDGRRVDVRVYRAAGGRETLLGQGWGAICDDFGLVPGDLAVFSRTEHLGKFTARFVDADGNDRLSRFVAPDDPPSSPEFQVDADLLRARAAEAGRGGGWGWQAAGAAAGGGDRPLQVDDDMTIREAMDLAVECGAREGSDEHYMATRLFVKAENRAMFLTFRTNAGRLQWLRRCYQDRSN